MRSVRSQRIYKTVSHQSWCLGLFYYSTVFNLSEGSILTQISAVSFVPKSFSTRLWTEAPFPFRSPSKVILCPEMQTESPDTVVAFSNSVWHGWPPLSTHCCRRWHLVMHLIFMRNMTLRCCGGGQLQVLMAFRGTCVVPRLLQAWTTRRSFSYTAYGRRPGIGQYDWVTKECSCIMHYAFMVFGWPSPLKQNFDAARRMTDSSEPSVRVSRSKLSLWFVKRSQIFQ